MFVNFSGYYHDLNSRKVKVSYLEESVIWRFITLIPHLFFKSLLKKKQNKFKFWKLGYFSSRFLIYFLSTLQKYTQWQIKTGARKANSTISILVFNLQQPFSHSKNGSQWSKWRKTDYFKHNNVKTESHILLKPF